MTYPLLRGQCYRAEWLQVLICPKEKLRKGYSETATSKACAKRCAWRHARLGRAMTTFVFCGQTKLSPFTEWPAVKGRAISDPPALVLSLALKVLKHSCDKAAHEEGCSIKLGKHICKSFGLSEATVQEEASFVNVHSDSDSDEDEEELNGIQRESLILLEWSSICAQVAQFASTAIGMQVAKSGNIPYGKNQAESEKLLDQTGSAYLLSSSLDFSGIVDVEAILKAAKADAVCSVNELCIIQKMLSSTGRLCKQLEHSVPRNPNTATGLSLNGCKGNDAFSLLSIMAGGNLCTSLEHELKESLDSSSLSILEAASPTLTAIRTSRRKNMEALEALLREIGEQIVEAGGMDSVIVTTRRARLCVAVKASHRNLVSGGVVLDVSNSGATLFMEPKVALELNNNEVQLASMEKAEEFAILKILTCKLANVAEEVWILLEKATLLDIACARAEHAKWLGSVKPAFDMRKHLSLKRKEHNTKISEAIDAFSVYIEGFSHPLLLGPALFDHQKQDMPVPVDFKVRSGVNVVVISGPNTGGKTASMKSLGVAALMAKAGLFLPAKGNAVLPWFDKVLADIGDSQSLQQSLSTFSGHIQRVCRIMQAGNERSLVLLDEIGSGTDPSEGAALATAILHDMANHMHLTVVTTHFAELSQLREQDERFEVASLEFDSKTLRPKYKVLWGCAGQSNALDIAASLGIDESILVRARHWMTKLAPENHNERVSQLMDPLMEQRKILQSQAENAALTLSKAMELHNELVAEAYDLEKRVAALRLQREDDLNRDIDIVKSRMDEIISTFEWSSRNRHEDARYMSMRDANSAIASIVETYIEKFGQLRKAHTDVQAVERPSVGDLVLIQRLGKKLATVVEIPTNGDDTLLVQFGSLKARVKLSEVAKTMKQPKNPGDLQRSKRSSAQTTSSENVELKFDAAIQTSRNTVDLRGMYVEDALLQLDRAIGNTKPMSVLFVIHGEGTGALRRAVLQKLNGHPLVVKFEQESPMNFGCTVIYIK